MIVYVCDICKSRHNSLSELYKMTIENARDNKQLLVHDGKYHICGRCQRAITNMMLCTVAPGQMPKEEVDEIDEMRGEIFESMFQHLLDNK